MGTELYPLWDLLPQSLMLPTREDPLGGFDDEGSEGTV
jgi:hypothetical protein